jgi:hypothetical protein
MKLLSFAYKGAIVRLGDNVERRGRYRKGEAHVVGGVTARLPTQGGSGGDDASKVALAKGVAHLHTHHPR